MAKRNTRARGWVWTLNVADKGDVQSLIDEGQKITSNLKTHGVQYIVYQIERGEKEEREHIQGYFYFANARYFDAVKEYVGERSHIDGARGSATQCKKYCTKKDGDPEYPGKGGCLDGTEPYEWGDMPQQGKRTEWQQIASMCESGSSDRELVDAYPKEYAICGRGIERIRGVIRRDRWRERNGPERVIFIWGAPGVGKTRHVFENHERGAIYSVVDSGTRYWWDGYSPEEHKVVIFDEFFGEHSHNNVLKWIDRYPAVGEVKGGSIELMYETVYIISNWDLDTVSKRFRSPEAFKRRITSILHICADTEVAEVILNSATEETKKVDDIDEVWELWKQCL